MSLEEARIKRCRGYLNLSEERLAEAERLELNGRIHDAAGSYWFAVVALLDAFGELRGLPHFSKLDYWDLVERIAEETNDPDISVMFRVTEGLEEDFMHRFMHESTFRKHAEYSRKLVEKLRSIICAEIQC